MMDSKSMKKDMKNQEKISRLTNEKLFALSNELLSQWSEIAEQFGITYLSTGSKYVAACPVHGGDCDNAFNLFYTGHTCSGNWRCHTRHCQSEFSNNMLGLLHGIMSHNKYGWEGHGDKTVEFSEVVEWAVHFIKKDISELKVDRSAFEKDIFATQINNIYSKSRPEPTTINRKAVRQQLQIPAKYYLDRGYSSAILDKYDVGLCNAPDKPMYNRVVVPIYDDNHKFMVGCTGRSLYEKCASCKRHHKPGDRCPGGKDIVNATKWRHSFNFQKEEFLYNYWYAKPYIQQSTVAVLVESPGNVWRLEEAGIHNSLGLFGCSLSMGQRAMLDKSGALTLVLLMDNDEAGQRASTLIQQECSRAYNIITPTLNYPDIGEMPVVAVQEFFKTIETPRYI